MKVKTRRLQRGFRRLRLRLSDSIDLMNSRAVDIQDVESVCLALGPYRNLTTLTASVLFLHPNCQVLNHAGKRIYGNRQVDFLSDYSKDRFERFVQFGIQISGKGQRGGLGGSITYSHAFDAQHELKEVYEKTGFGQLKNEINCLFWKESLRTSNLIRERQVDLATIFEEENRLRFLLPIRHPLDCAVSNLRTGHVRIFQGLNKGSSIFDVVEAVLDEIFWFAALREAFPDRFFYFFEHEISRTMLVNLARFLQLEEDEAWITSALSAMKIKPGYKHDRELTSFYRDRVNEKGSRLPELSAGLLYFVSGSDPQDA